MKVAFILLLLFNLNLSFGQQYCPGTYVHELIGSDSVPAQTSTYLAPINCWANTTQIILSTTTFPSGLDLAVVITEINGANGSIIDLSTSNPVSVGDSLFLRKNNIHFDIELQHLSLAGIEFDIVLFGYPTEYEQAHDCSYYLGGLYYPPFCISYGLHIASDEDCHTCELAALDERNNSQVNLIYPNPTINEIKIDIDHTGNIKFVITNMIGETIKSNELPQSKIIDVSSLEKGTYIFHLVNEKGTNLGYQVFIKS